MAVELLKAICDYLYKHPDFIGAILVACGIYIAVRDNKKARFIEVFSQYTQRYSTTMSKLPEKARQVKSLEALDNEQQQKTLQVFREYFNLCSEEMFLAKGGYIDKKTWEIWRSGIQGTFSQFQISNILWKKLRAEYNFFPEFQKLADSFVVVDKIPEEEKVQDEQVESRNDLKVLNERIMF